MQIKVIARGVKNYRLELVNEKNEVLFTGHYKDFTKAAALEHFKNLLDEHFKKRG